MPCSRARKYISSAVERRVIHIDLDAFYASVEQRDNPHLRGKPVAVGELKPRHVVATASYEARTYGVRSAMPCWLARQVCPALVFVKPRHSVYSEVSDAVHEIFNEYCSLVEPMSLDEAYLDVTDNCETFRDAELLATEIRKNIQNRCGITASAGISYNKFLAKMASGENKPNGQFVILPDEGARYVRYLNIEKFHGVGPATAAKMRRMGVFIGKDLYEMNKAELERKFGKSAEYYYNISRGIDERPVDPVHVRRSSGVQHTFAKDLTTLAQIERGLAKLSDELWQWCQDHQWHGRTVTVKIRYSDFTTITRQRSFINPIRSVDELYTASLDLVKGVFPLVQPIRLLGITISSPQETNV